MDFSEKELDQIEVMASLYLTPTDIAIVLQVPAHEFKAELKRHGSPAAKSYLRGKVATKIKLRKQEMALAQVGSPLALQTINSALQDMEDDE